MPTLMTYWKTVRTTVLKPRNDGYRSLSAGEAAASRRRLTQLRDTMPSGC